MGAAEDQKKTPNLQVERENNRYFRPVDHVRSSNTYDEKVIGKAVYKPSAKKIINGLKTPTYASKCFSHNQEPSQPFKRPDLPEFQPTYQTSTNSAWAEKQMHFSGSQPTGEKVFTRNPKINNPITGIGEAKEIKQKD